MEAAMEAAVIVAAREAPAVLMAARQPIKQR